MLKVECKESQHARAETWDIYVYMCVCVCVCVLLADASPAALLAEASVLVVLADARTATLLAPASYVVMLADPPHCLQLLLTLCLPCRAGSPGQRTRSLLHIRGARRMLTFAAFRALGMRVRQPTRRLTYADVC